MTIDVIGDVHGHATELEALLKFLGYQEINGAYRHSDPQRTVVFVGDLIDRGPEQLRCLEIARAMRDVGTAAVVMGNHEHNAIGYAARDPDRPKHFMRIRGSKNTAQHAAFLDAVGLDTPLHKEWVDWMTTLPLFLDLGPVKIVHACWHQDQINRLKSLSESDDGVLSSETLLDTFRKGAEARNAAEIVLKGLEIQLPDGMFFHDKDGHKRTKSRLRWWDAEADTFATSAIGEPGINELPQTPLPSEAIVPDLGDQIVFFGHYWMTGYPRILSDSRTCLDFSVAKDGHLCAYTWRGETALDHDHLSWVGGRKINLSEGLTRNAP